MVEAWFACDGAIGGCACTHHDLPSTRLRQQSLQALFSARENDSTLDKNLNPSGIVTAQIQSLKDDLADIQRNREQLVLAEKLMEAQLAAVKARIQTSLRTERGIIHKLGAAVCPILRLPADVLELIFDCVVRRVEMPQRGGSRETWSESCRLARSEPPSLLGALALTCERWKSVLKNRSRMWSYIYIDIAHRVRFETFYKPCTTEQLSCTSARTPLHVAIGMAGEHTVKKYFDLETCTFTDMEAEYEDNVGILTDCFCFLSRYSDRIKQLDLLLPDILLHHVVDASGFTSRMSKLERVEALCVERELSRTSMLFPGGNLKTIRLIDVQNVCELGGVSNPWAIEEFIIEDSRVSGNARFGCRVADDLDILDILERYPSLQCLTMDIADIAYDDDSDSDGPVPIPTQLVKVDISAVSWSPVFLADFTAPKLKRLRLAMVGHGRHRADALPNVVRFLKRSRPPLRALHIENIEANSKRFMQLTKLARSLTELHIIDYPELQDVVELLETAPYAFPHLRALELRGNMGSCRGLAVRIVNTWADTPLDDLRLYWDEWYDSTSKENEDSGGEDDSSEEDEDSDNEDENPDDEDEDEDDEDEDEDDEDEDSDEEDEDPGNGDEDSGDGNEGSGEENNDPGEESKYLSEDLDLWAMEVSGALMHIPMRRLELGRR
ncbi:hypothetical protein CYLTODRAFT_488425 [Cylindrobasidium torrendii FP15055 ss-10]|uniref:F-box domain-containing protein n=1 Tax=Cylindrobasidium torrendii FP15055 ss-10 TaxID=1314674 RepID=A0A0D7BIJ3_9AGAR|nr:hypothetical protein CYLTODRAFT_488425 [Cylindrobasidium torrendii FP15055 ss-10]